MERKVEMGVSGVDIVWSDLGVQCPFSAFHCNRTATFSAAAVSTLFVFDHCSITENSVTHALLLFSGARSVR